MTKVLLVNPKYPETTSSSAVYSADVLGYIASLAIADGHEVKFVDANALDLSAADLKPVINEFKPNALITVTSSLDAGFVRTSRSGIVQHSGNRESAQQRNPDRAHWTAWNNGAAGNAERSTSVDTVVRGEPEMTARDWIAPFPTARNYESVTGHRVPQNRRDRADRGASVHWRTSRSCPPAYHFSRWRIPLPRQLPAAPVRDRAGQPRLPVQVHLLSHYHAGQAVALRNTTKVAEEMVMAFARLGIKSVMFFRFRIWAQPRPHP